MPDPRIWPIPAATDTFATVTGVSTLVLAANPRRVDADLTNDSNVAMYLARGNAAVVGSGIPLNPGGSSYHIGTGNLFLGEIYAIHGLVQQDERNLAISEGYKPE